MTKSREPARTGQSQPAKKRPARQPVESEPSQYSPPLPPRLVPGGIYSEQDVIHNLGMRSDTLRKARRRKVRPLKPLNTGTRQIYYTYEELIAYFSDSSTAD